MELERRTAVDTILSFDEDWMRGQSVGIFPVHNSTAGAFGHRARKDPGFRGRWSEPTYGQAAAHRPHECHPGGGAQARIAARRREVDQAASIIRQWRAPASKSTRSATAIAARLRSCSATCLLAAGGARSESATNQIAPGANASSLSSPGGAAGQSGFGPQGTGGGGGLGEVEALARAAVRSNRDLAGKAQGEAEVLVLAEVWAPVNPKALYPLVRARGPARAEPMRREQAARVVA